MIDFLQAREKMVDCQIRTSDVTNHELLTAFLSVPREEFVADSHKALAYIDEDIPLTELGGENRFVTEPAQLSRLLQAAAINPEDIVLVVGTGSGYSTAVISLLASSVVSVEENKDLAEFATEKLNELGFNNVAVVNSNHSSGLEKEAPYDVIYIDGAVEQVPGGLLEQLADNGKLIAVEGTGNSAVARIFVMENGLISKRSLMNCAIKPIPGFEAEEGFVF